MMVSGDRADCALPSYAPVIRPASRTLLVIGAVVAIGAVPLSLRGQAREQAAPSPFDPIARRVLTLKLESETLRSRLGAADEGWPRSWGDSLGSLRSGVGRLTTEAQRLEDQKQPGAAQLRALTDRARAALETLARAADPRRARTALAHLDAVLDALQEQIAEAESTRRE
jgi:hypothetical protein